MKKLLKLLNEYWKPSARNKKREKLDLECVDRFYAISKYYGFIKRLVDNDKIIFDENEYKQSIEELNKDYRPFEEYELLLMVLSIQDNPIEFLVSILK